MLILSNTVAEISAQADSNPSARRSNKVGRVLRIACSPLLQWYNAMPLPDPSTRNKIKYSLFSGIQDEEPEIGVLVGLSGTVLETVLTPWCIRSLLLLVWCVQTFLR